MKKITTLLLLGVSLYACGPQKPRAIGPATCDCVEKAGIDRSISIMEKMDSTTMELNSDYLDSVYLEIKKCAKHVVIIEDGMETLPKNETEAQNLMRGNCPKVNDFMFLYKFVKNDDVLGMGE